MSITAEAVRVEMQEHLKTVADLAPSTNRKAALAWASRAVGLPAGRVKSLFYGEARRVEAHEADQIRAYVEAAKTLLGARAQYEQKRRDFLRDHPNLARLIPREVRDEALSRAAQAAIAEEDHY